MVRRRLRSRRGAALAQEVRDLDAMRLEMALEAEARSGAQVDSGASPRQLLCNAALRRDPFFVQLSAQVAHRRLQLLRLLHDSRSPGPLTPPAVAAAAAAAGGGHHGRYGAVGASIRVGSVSSATAKRRAALQTGVTAALLAEVVPEVAAAPAATNDSASGALVLRPKLPPAARLASAGAEPSNGIDAGDWTRPVWDSAETPGEAGGIYNGNYDDTDDAEGDADAGRPTTRPFLKRRSRNLPMGRMSDFSKVAPRVDCKLRTCTTTNTTAAGVPLAVLADATNAMQLPTNDPHAAVSPNKATAAARTRPDGGSPTPKRGSYRKSLKQIKSRVYGHLHSAPPRTKSPEASPERLLQQTKQTDAPDAAPPPSPSRQPTARSPVAAAAARASVVVSESRRRRHASPSSVLDPRTSAEAAEAVRASPALEALFAAALAGGRVVRSESLFPAGGGRVRGSLLPRLDPSDPRLHEMASAPPAPAGQLYAALQQKLHTQPTQLSFCRVWAE
jgi:hypothetical protein